MRIGATATERPPPSCAQKGYPRRLPTAAGCPDNLCLMADAAQSQTGRPRLAAVREQLSLLSDYL